MLMSELGADAGVVLQMAASDYVPIFFKNRLHLAGRPQMSSRPKLLLPVCAASLLPSHFSKRKQCGDFGFDIISNRTSSAKRERDRNLISFEIEHPSTAKSPSWISVISIVTANLGSDDRVIGLLEACG